MVHKKNIAVFTVCNIAYLPRALVLAESLKFYDGRQLNIVIFDKRQAISIPDGLANIIWAEELGVPKFLELAFMYDIIEFSTSLKPFIALKLLKSHDAVIFLDPDTCLFSSLSPVEQDLEVHPIVLTPHHCSPQPSTPEESDLPMMRFGSFNLGFFAVTNERSAIHFLEWWNNRCINFCFMESQFGLSTDQKWISIAPCLFRELYVSFNMGYNMSAWNTFEREVVRNQAGVYLVKSKVSDEIFNLVFFHFSNFRSDDPEYLNKRASNEIGNRYPTLGELGAFYRDQLAKFTAIIKSEPYTYDYMSDGCYISPTLRRAYAAVLTELPEGHNPFDADGPVGVFARKNYLISQKVSSYRYPGIKEAQKYGLQLKLIYAALRMILRIVGPNRFYDLSKLFVFLSMYRKNRGLWKI